MFVNGEEWLTLNQCESWRVDKLNKHHMVFDIMRTKNCTAKGVFVL